MTQNGGTKNRLNDLEPAICASERDEAVERIGRKAAIDDADQGIFFQYISNSCRDF